MDILSSFKGSNSNRAAQYFITLLVLLLVGYLISLLPIMSRLEIAKGISAAKLIIFFTEIVALVLFYFFAIRAISALPKQGGVLFFIRSLMVPGTLLIIVIIGQAVLWHVLDPFIGSAGKKAYLGIAVLLIVLVGIWFVWVAYQNSPHLIESTRQITYNLPRLTSFQTSACPECGQFSDRNAQFCDHCGQPKQKEVTCVGCGAVLSPDQKFCQHCGHAVEAMETSPIEETSDSQ
jgi:RNA polymerase subunit RPABC4/transcription elongation factor Spt4